ncbi:unnamed protein product [Prorocentrum cordatum]|uniref:Copper transporter n=1 Tax=Prorocentrum cordatum TaxID=2364126 RepID=A0ABN9TW14_9DINO|nr:unnamed protein product [Polarella glacialis]
MDIQRSGTSNTKADGTSNPPRALWKEGLHLVGGHAYLELVVVALLLLEAWIRIERILPPWKPECWKPEYLKPKGPSSSFGHLGSKSIIIITEIGIFFPRWRERAGVARSTHQRSAREAQPPA